MKSKKGVEIAMNVVIISVIALLVLVVVVFIFAGKTQSFSKGVSDCISLGGTCEDRNCLTLLPPRPSIPNGDCTKAQDEVRYCCSKIQ